MENPNFFIIGARKCGTTSMATWLGEHPSVFISPIKEPSFFSEDLNHRHIKDWKTYINLFDKAGSEHTAIGEASTAYLFSEAAVPAIEKEFRRPYYIVMLRNPVEMAYSLHGQEIRMLHEDIKDFQKAWKLSPERRVGKHTPRGCKHSTILDYQSWCKLGEQLSRLYATVPADRRLVLVLDDIKENPRREYQRALDFLEVPSDNRQHFPVYNPAREWRSQSLGKIIRDMARGVTWAKHIAHILPKRSLGIIDTFMQISSRQHSRPPLSAELRAELREFYARDIQQMEDLLDRRFPSW